MSSVIILENYRKQAHNSFLEIIFTRILRFLRKKYDILFGGSPFPGLWLSLSRVADARLGFGDTTAGTLTSQHPPTSKSQPHWTNGAT